MNLAAFLDETPNLLRLVVAERCRRSFAAFVREAWHVTDPTVALEWNWHHEAICLHLQRMFEDWRRVRRGELPSPPPVQNLLINIPPGTAKSRLVSVFFPAWAWLHEPAWKVICLSANPQVAERDAPISRQLIESPWYQQHFTPWWKLDEAINARDWYANTAGGDRRSFGIAAKIVGLRADCLIVDDPNDPKEVHSAATREGVNVRAWDQAIANRVNDLRVSLRIGVMQRLHEHDWAGHVLAQGGWEHLFIPLLYEEHGCRCPSCARGATLYGWRDPRTVDGEVLHSARFTPEVIDGERRRLGSYGFAGQMQQRPAPARGGILQPRWFSRYDDIPRDRHNEPAFDFIWISVDASFKKTATGSRVAVLVVARKGGQRWVLDNDTRPMDYVLTKEALRAMRAKWPQVTKVLIEDKANGPALVSELSAEWPDVVAHSPGSDSKEARAMSVQPQIESGAVWIPRHAAWVDDFLHEVATFPAGAHDDQVDALTQALIEMRASGDLWAV